MLQWAFGFEQIVLRVACVWEAAELIVDNILTYSLKALHVGVHTTYHMTANIRLMSYSKLRVDAHVLLDIGAFYLRRDRNGLSVATHMDSEAPGQYCSRRSR